MQPLTAIPSPMFSSYSTGFIEIDTKAIVHNYRMLRSMAPHSWCGAVLKANAYGFGIQEIAPILVNEGCQSFFVAHLEEGLVLRSFLKAARIYILSGLITDAADLYIEKSLIPVLNDFEMVKNWALTAQKRKKKLPCALHLDTGMRRNGFDTHDLTKLFESLDILSRLEVHFVMSHLVSSQNFHDPLNEQQRELFGALLRHFPKLKASLADTGGIYLGKAFHYDIVRPGKGIFGLYTPPLGAPPLHSCLKVFARILQIRTANKGESIGYGATYVLTQKSKLATLGVGFADGYDRRLSNKGYVEFQGFKAPIVGRISMDYTVVDITGIPEHLCHIGGWATLVNETLTLDRLADSIGTISRELSTGFGERLSRVYRN